jgi:hypothetical protein
MSHYIDQSIVLYSLSTVPQAWGHDPINVWIARVGTKTYQASSFELLQELVSEILNQLKEKSEKGLLDENSIFRGNYEH